MLVVERFPDADVAQVTAGRGGGARGHGAGAFRDHRRHRRVPAGRLPGRRPRNRLGIAALVGLGAHAASSSACSPGRGGRRSSPSGRSRRRWSRRCTCCAWATTAVHHDDPARAGRRHGAGRGRRGRRRGGHPCPGAPSAGRTVSRPSRPSSVPPWSAARSPLAYATVITLLAVAPLLFLQRHRPAPSPGPRC